MLWYSMTARRPAMVHAHSLAVCIASGSSTLSALPIIMHTIFIASLKEVSTRSKTPYLEAKNNVLVDDFFCDALVPPPVYSIRPATI